MGCFLYTQISDQEWGLNGDIAQKNPAFFDLVSQNTSAVLSLLGFDSSTEVVDQRTGVWIYQAEQPVISVYEGCNGLNIMVIFVSFLFAFGKLQRS